MEVVVDDDSLVDPGVTFRTSKSKDPWAAASVRGPA